MNTEIQFPETLVEAVKYFGEGDNAFTFMVGLRWPQGVKCPQCGSDRVGFIATRKIWQCKCCTVKKQFTIKTGTIFEDSALSLEKWLAAIWLIANAKNGISSYEIHRSIGVTQKTAWFMLQRIRLAMQTGSFEKMKGIVEVDETFIGAKARNMHADKKREKGIGTGGVSLTPVMGLLERTTGEQASRVKLKHVKTRKRKELSAEVREHVEKGAEVHTDSFRSYCGLEDGYVHKVVDHAIAYVEGNVHTNGLENFWSLLKRTIKGTYVNVEPFHLFRYLDEQAFRFNERKDNDAGRFIKAVHGVIGKGLTYLELTEGKGGDGLPRSPEAWQAV